jgi:hypothetical protein
MREKGFRVAMFNDSTGYEYARHVGKHIKDAKGFSPFERRVLRPQKAL